MSLQTHDRLAAVMASYGQPGTCEITLVILKGMTPAEQSRAGVSYPTQMKGLALQYPRFSTEAPLVVQAAEDALALGL